MDFKKILQILSASALILCYQNCTEFESLNNNVASSNQELTSGSEEQSSSSPGVNEEAEVNPLPEVEEENENPMAQLLSCNSILKKSQETFTWTDPEQTEQTIYDFRLGSGPDTKDIYDHVGNNQFNLLELQVDDLPTDGRLIYQTLYIFRDGPGDEPLIISCQLTAANIVETPIENENMAGVHYLKFPQHKVSEGSFDGDLWDSITSFKFNYDGSSNLKSVVNFNDKWWLQLRHEASSNGSRRILMNSDIPKSTRGYKLTQTLLFKPGWSPGGTSQSGKLGFGLAGGTSQSGGKVGTDGWSVRMSWSRDEIRFYNYYANRPYLVQGRNPAYGDQIATGFKYVTGVEYKIIVEIILNTPNKSDGVFKASINGKNVVTKTNVLWMTGSEPEVDKLWLSSFHGGNTTAWSPTSESMILVRDVSLEKL